MQDKYNLGCSVIQGGNPMESVIINLMDNVLTDEDVKHINALEANHKIDDDLYATMNDIKLFFFKKGLKTGISMIDYCEK